MPQGLICAGDLFDSCMEAVLANCTQTVSSRDDVLGGGPDRQSMLNEYTKVLAALKVAGLTCDPAKTAVGLSEIVFFGMKWDSNGMRPDPRKIEALRKSKPPTNQEILNSWICCLSWNDTFVHRFSEIVKPLRDLANTKGYIQMLGSVRTIQPTSMVVLLLFCLKRMKAEISCLSTMPAHPSAQWKTIIRKWKSRPVHSAGGSITSDIT